MIDIWIFNYSTILLSIRITLNKAVARYNFTDEDLTNASFIIAKSMYEKAKHDTAKLPVYKIFDKVTHLLLLYLGKNGVYLARINKKYSRYLPVTIGFFRNLDTDERVGLAFTIGDVGSVLHIISDYIKKNFNREVVFV